MAFLPRDWNQGGANQIPGWGRPNLRDILNSLMGQGSVAEAKALSADQRTDGGRLYVNGRWYTFSAASVAASDGDQLVIVPDSGTGRWLAEPGTVVDLALPFTFATADAAVLWTVPTGRALLLLRGYWEIIASMTGGTTPAIGLSSSQSPHNTKGDLLGGASGDLTATLVAGDHIEGTVGTDQAAGIILRAGSTVRFDRIADAFAAGSGNAHLVGVVLA